MTTQLEMRFLKPAVADAEVAELVGVLRDARTWVSTERIKRLTGMNDRRIRAAAEASNGLVLSGPGSPGYMLTEFASMDTKDLIVRKIVRQAKRMIARAKAIERRHYETCVEA
jgi:hypothetical protein